jgi:EthD domain
MMVKMFVMIPRDRKVSRQEFHDHWRHPHATLGLGLSGVAGRVQSHQIDCGHLAADQARFEAIGEAWFESIDDALGMAEDEHYTTQLQPDERHFIDLERLDFLFCTEEVVVERATEEDGVNPLDAQWCERDRPTSIKLMQFVPRGSEPWTSDEDRTLGLRVGALRHVRAHGSGSTRGGQSQWRGVRELWWPTRWDFEAGVARDREAWVRLQGTAGGTALSLLTFSERWHSRRPTPPERCASEPATER